MIAQAIKTRKVTASACTLLALLDESLTDVPEKSVLTITSKVVSLCEGRVAPIEGTDLPALVRAEAEYYMPDAQAQNGYVFTVAHNMLTLNSGIDESNANGQYVLWPSDPQATANEVRAYLCKRFAIQDVGVIINDSTFMALRWGSISLALAYSGINPLRTYYDKTDLFGRPLIYTRTNVVDSLATVAAFLTGEGDEQTPLVLITNLEGSVEFKRHNPTAEELAGRKVSLETDSFAPMLQAIDWKPGGKKPSGN